MFLSKNSKTNTHLGDNNFLGVSTGVKKMSMKFLELNDDSLNIEKTVIFKRITTWRSNYCNLNFVK